jgi:group I intron endonuclease
MGRRKKYLTEEERLEAQRKDSMKYYLNNCEKIKKRNLKKNIMREKKSGIYKITNLINNKIYVGSTLDFDGRWWDHKKRLRKGNHHSIKLQRSYNIHGENNILFEVLEECSADELLIKEQYYMDLYDTYKNGYNCRPKDENHLGAKRSEESKKKMSESAKKSKRQPCSEETKKKDICG